MIVGKIASQCDGYDSTAIFEKVKQATLEVKQGNACYERDSCLFYEPEYNYPLIAYLEKFLSENYDTLKIIDWGGALGSAYYQNRFFFDTEKYKILWTVVEQSHFVEFGKNYLEDETLKFEQIYDVNLSSDNCIILSSVLQYIEEYITILDRIVEKHPKNIIIERTPVSEQERIVIERVKEPIYNASYPCRLLCEQTLKDYFIHNGYVLVDQWRSLVDSDIVIGDNVYQLKSFVFTYRE